MEDLMMIIKNYDEVRLHFTDATFNDFDNLKPYLQRALRKLLKIIPKSLYDVALAHHNKPIPDPDHENPVPEVPLDENAPSDDDLDKLVFLIQGCLVFYAFYKRLPLQNATLKEDGLVQTWNDNLRPMRAEDFKNYRNEVLFLFHDSVEALIEFLNSKSFSQWESSDEKKRSQQTLFLSASDFSACVPIDDNVRFFYLIIPEILNAQNILKNDLSSKLGSLIADVHSNSVPVSDLSLLAACRYFCAYYAMIKIAVRISSEDMPACLHGVVVSPESRDANSASYARMAESKRLEVVKLNQPDPADPLIPIHVPGAQNSNKGLSI